VECVVIGRDGVHVAQFTLLCGRVQHTVVSSVYNGPTCQNMTAAAHLAAVCLGLAWIESFVCCALFVPHMLSCCGTVSAGWGAGLCTPVPRMKGTSAHHPRVLQVEVESGHRAVFAKG